MEETKNKNIKEIEALENKKPKLVEREDIIRIIIGICLLPILIGIRPLKRAKVHIVEKKTEIAKIDEKIKKLKSVK